MGHPIASKVRLARRCAAALLVVLGCCAAPLSGIAGTPGVLFDQLNLPDGTPPSGGGGTGNDIKVNAYSRPADVFRSAEGADDFIVADPAGWTVSAVRVRACGDGLPCYPSSFANIRIYADRRGVPAATPVCSALNTPVIATFEGDPGDPSNQAGTALATFAAPCVLAPGTYWLGVSFVEVTPTPGPGIHRSWWTSMVREQPQTGHAALFRNPGLGYDDGPFTLPPRCADWGLLINCQPIFFLGSPHDEFSFQILGEIGRAQGAIELAVTAAQADAGGADACGSSSRIAVSPGDRVNLCYRVTNRSGADLNVQSLSDSLAGLDLDAIDQRIPLGATWQYNRVITAGSETQIVSTWTAQDQRASYRVDDSVPAAYVDLSTSPTARVLNDVVWRENYAQWLDLPFAFAFYGRPSTTVCMGENGFIDVVTAAWTDITCTGGGTQPLPLPVELGHAGLSAIVPSWIDLEAGRTVPAMYFDVIGTTPGTRQLAYEWHDIARYAPELESPGRIRFEVLIDEATSAITFQYANMAFADALSPSGDYGQLASVGLQEDAQHAISYSWQAPTLTNGKAIRWTPVAPMLYSASATVQFDVGHPTLALTPTALSASAPQGGSARIDLHIANTGDRPLRWTLEEIPARRPAAAGSLAENRLRASSASGTSGSPLPEPAFALVRGLYVDEYNFVSLDLAAPASGMRVIGPTPADGVPRPGGGTVDPEYTAAAFLGNDFGRLYLLGTAGAFGYLDTASGAFTLLNPWMLTGICGSQLPCFTGLAWDDSAGVLYASGRNVDGDTGLYSSRLYRIDPATTTVTPIGSVTQDVALSSIAIDANGQMYGVDPVSDTLLAIDKDSGVIQPVGSLGADIGNPSIAFDPSTGVLWMSAARNGEQRLLTVDPQTGAILSDASPPSGTSSITAFAIAVAHGECARPGDIPWLSYAQHDGSIDPGAHSDIELQLDASALAAGEYSADVCVGSNDPAYLNRPAAVPLHFTVGDAGERIFADGFDAAR